MGCLPQSGPFLTDRRLSSTPPPVRAAGGGHETVKILKVPLLPIDRPTEPIRYDRPIAFNKPPHRESVASRFLLPHVPPCEPDQPVIDLVQKNEEH